jgi:PAS domain S-box-containing protein
MLNYANLLDQSCAASGTSVVIVGALGSIEAVHGAPCRDPHGAAVDPTGQRILDAAVADLVTSAAAIRGEFRAGVRRVMAGGVPFETEYRSDDAGRGWRRLRVYAAGDSSLVVLVVDVTAKREAEHTRRHVEALYRLATREGRVGVWDLNLETGAMFIDPILKSMLGYGDDEIRNHIDAWQPLVDPADRDVVARRLQEHLEGRTELYEVEHRMVGRDGGRRWFIARGVIVERRAGRPFRLVGTDADITELKVAERALVESRVQLHHRRREIARLRDELMLAQEAERARIARELHDDVSQRIAALEIIATDARRRPREGRAEATLDEIIHRLSELARDIRRLSHTMAPPAATSGYLHDQLTGYAAELQRLYGLRVHVRVDGLPETVPNLAAVALYRVVQEALWNVAQHAEAASAAVDLDVEAGGIRLRVVDEGTGFDPGESPAAGGFGLSSMRQRVEQLGGRLEIDAAPGRGTRVFAWVPLPT